MLTELFDDLIDELESGDFSYGDAVNKIYDLQDDCELILEREKEDSYQAGYTAGKHYRDSNANY